MKTSAATLPTDATVHDHPLVRDDTATHQNRLSAAERVCKKISDATGAPIALLLAIIIQFIWIIVGTLTHWDVYPFAFLLTCSNILQLILIFVIAVAQRQGSQYAEVRAESDHDHISLLLYHQQVQEQILLRLAQKTEAEVADLTSSVAMLLKDV
jgi:uncharacterized membrane protein